MNVKRATGATITFHELYKEKELDITQFGAISNGDPLINTRAINDAVKKAYKMKGATVVIPKGDYKSYSINLKSNVNLRLEKDAVLRAAKTDILKSYQKQNGEGGNYNEPEVNRYAGLQDHGHTYFANSLIYGYGVENVMIYGEGLINGSSIDSETGLLEYVLQGGDPHENLMRNQRGHDGEWFGNKAIALLKCNNIILKDFSILIGGHFAIIAEGVTNLLADHILVDTTRDAFDIDCCQNVTISQSVFNSLTDDALVLKASFGTGAFMPVKNVLIEDCTVCGYDAGSVYTGEYSKNKLIATDRCGPTARVKLGTESTCGFDLVTIQRVKFERSRGFALEAVDISDLSNIVFTDCRMDNVSSSPIFIRTGDRGRYPVTGNSMEEVVYAKDGNVRIDHTNWVLPNTKEYESYPAMRFIPSYRKNQIVSVDGNSEFTIVNQETPAEMNLSNVKEIDGTYYLMIYDKEQRKYVPDMSKKIAKEKLCYYANAVGSNKMPKVHNIEISNVKITNADPRYPMIIMGLTDAPIQNILLKNIYVEYRGGMKMEHAVEQRQLNTNWKYSQYKTKSSVQTLPWLVNTFFLKAEGLLPRVDWDQENGGWKDDPYNVPEMADVYPEPSNWGILPAYGLYARHVKGLELSKVCLCYKVEDERHAIVLDDVCDVRIDKLQASYKEGVAAVATVTNYFKRHTNLEYIPNEAYFTTTVNQLVIAKEVEVQNVVVNAPAPGTPNDKYYTYPTIPIPENGYSYPIPTDCYPLPQTVFRPFVSAMKKQVIKANEELKLILKVLDPATEVVKEDTDCFIYNEAVTKKEYIVKGIEKKIEMVITNLPRGAIFDKNSRTLSWIPDKSQAGEYMITIVIDDGIIKEEEKVLIEVQRCE